MVSRVLISGYVVGMIQTNVWFLHREGETDTIVVDPADRGDQIYEAITGLNAWNEQPQAGQPHLSIKAILLTHAHFDHIGGLAALKARSGAPVYVNEAEKRLCEDTDANLSAGYHRPVTVHPDHWVHDGDVLDLCGIRFHVIATPGHTEGSCCYYIEGNTSSKLTSEESRDMSAGGTQEAPILIAGDTLFAESVGRTDMPTGSTSAIVHSVREKLFLLPDTTRVFPGHGPCTTIGHEKQYNSFV